ncbi:hypothetical protein Peur_057814 [Populus x canadensis]
MTNHFLADNFDMMPTSVSICCLTFHLCGASAQPVLLAVKLLDYPVILNGNNLLFSCQSRTSQCFK